MGKILCATRGGEASRRTQEEAIKLAKERGDDLIFLYVVDLSFLDKTIVQHVVDVSSGLEQMGDFLLALAQEKAQQHGVNAQLVHRRGNTREEIKAAARELGVDLVVLGRPSGRKGEDFFALEELRAFANEIEAETGVRVVIV